MSKKGTIFNLQVPYESATKKSKMLSWCSLENILFYFFKSMKAGDGHQRTWNATKVIDVFLGFIQ